MNWYSLRVMSGREEKVRDTIFRELDDEKELRSNVEEILIPTENVVDIKNGKKQLKKKVFFPGYVLVKMDMNNETKFFIESMDGVMSFVGPKGNPQALNDSEIKRIIGSSADGDDEAAGEIEESPFKVGDSVKVIDGPLVKSKRFRLRLETLLKLLTGRSKNLMVWFKRLMIQTELKLM